MTQKIIERMTNKTSPLGMGCWAIGGEWSLDGSPAGWGKADQAESIAAINAAYDAGIRCFDTAANYGTGLSEELLGKALGSKRRDCIISTKFGFVVDEASKSVRWPLLDKDGSAADRVVKECEASLRRLGTDFIDVYFFHQWDYDKKLALELRDKLDALVRAGKIGSYGWSTDDPVLASIFAEGEHCSAIQCTLNVVQDNPSMLALCEQHQILAFNKSPLAMGFLSGKHSSDATFPVGDVRSSEWARETFQKPVSKNLSALRDILTSGGRTLVQGSLAWIWGRSSQTLPTPGIRTVKQAVENAKAMEYGPLTPRQMEEIESILGR